MSLQTCTAVLLFIFSALAWASPQQSALEQQLASVQRQHDSVQRQLASVHRVSRHSVIAAPVLQPIAISSPVPALTPIAALEPISPPLELPQLDCPPIAEEEADGLIDAAASEQALSPALLRSVIKHESAFRPCAVSIKGAQGLMQLMPATAEQFGVINPFDPRQNIGGGAAFLRQLLNRYSGDLKLALGAYNAGIGRVESSGGVPNILETQSYVSSILEDLGATEQNPSPKEQPNNEDSRGNILQLPLNPAPTVTSPGQLPIGN